MIANRTIRGYLALCLLTLHGLAAADTEYVAASIEPVRMILAELVGPEAAVCVVPRSASPHTYDPRVADAIATTKAAAMFSVDPLFDGWASRLPATHHVALLDRLPQVREVLAADHVGHDHGPNDPHFWSDPIAVQLIVPKIVAQLDRLSFGDSDAIAERAQKFQRSLTQLDAELFKRFAPLRGKRVIVGHSSWLYFLERYRIEVAAIIEASPGQEMSLRRFADLSEELAHANADAIIAEPQHGLKAAEALAKQSGIPMCTIDPLWAGDGTYAGLIRENANRILAVLE